MPNTFGYPPPPFYVWYVPLGNVQKLEERVEDLAVGTAFFAFLFCSRIICIHSSFIQ